MPTHWTIRESLSQEGRLQRSYYELLRDELDQFILRYALVGSFDNFRKKKMKYPFVEKRELKPRAIIPDLEYEHHNTFLILFIEGSVPAAYKKYIRFFDVNKTTKTNLLHSKSLPLSDNFDRTQKYFDSVHFIDFLNILLPVDYALLIQRDSTQRAKDRYQLSHFHVKIDWPIAEAAETMAQNLRYISKDLFEKGDKYAEDIQKKFFEYYGLPVMAGGRRTAAIVAAQFLRRIPCISTVYVGSSESRSLLRISERGVSKAVLMKFEEDEVRQLAESHRVAPQTFKKNYVVAKTGKYSVCIFQVTYNLTIHSHPPDDGKLRDLKPDLSWLSVGGQYILPKPKIWKYPPLPTNIIYS